jgi:hypothetical protein
MAPHACAVDGSGCSAAIGMWLRKRRDENKDMEKLLFEAVFDNTILPNWISTPSSTSIKKLLDNIRI